MDSTIVTAVIAACLALALVVLLVRARHRRTRADERFETVLEQLDVHMNAISQSLERVVERSSAARARGVDDLELTVEFGDLLRRIAIEAATRTGAEAAAVHIQGPGGAPMVGSFGADDRTGRLDAPLAHAAGPFRAVTINWTHRPEDEAEGDSFTSALVVPIVEAGIETGTLAAYAPNAGSFGAEHVRALEALAEDAVPAIASARRFAEAQRTMTDVLTGLRNRKGYDIELERAVAHAQETGQPLSLLILNREGEIDANKKTCMIRASTPRFASSRHSSCSRRGHPTSSACARTASSASCSRRPPATQRDVSTPGLRDEAARTTFPVADRLTFAVGVAEWRPDETSETFDGRATEAVQTSRMGVIELAAAEVGLESRTVTATRQDFEERLRHAIARARSLDRPLAVLLMNVDGLARVDERRDRATVERALAELETRVESNLENGDVSCHIGEEEFAVILSDATVDRAEAVLAALRASLEAHAPTEFEWLGMSAGITELAWGDDATSVFGRVEHALWRAKRAGTGTVVVAMAADDPRR